MLATRQMVVIGSLLVGLGVTGSAAASPKKPLWETQGTCATEWKTFTPKEEGDLPACHPGTTREWKVCKVEGRQPHYAWWCPAKAGTGQRPARFQE